MNSKGFIKLVIGIFIVVILTALFFLAFLMPKLDLEKTNLKVLVNENVETINYKATFLNQDITNKVTIDGVCDNTKVGEYPITYQLKFGAITIKKVLNIDVVDEEKPIITLTGSDDYHVCQISSYVEPGYVAMDNYDGDITSKVKTKEENNIITYSVSDSSGNESSITRTIKEADDEKPTITLNDKNPLYILKGSSFINPGAKATDNCDGNLTSQIKLDGSVDTSKNATYVLNYSVTDKRGNTATASRKVIVYEPSNNDVSAKGVIYLTFDDGPGAYTSQILDTLAKYNIKATFFVTNSGKDSVILREYQDGHTIGLHTATHQWSIYSSVDTYFNDLNIVSSRVKNITGYESKFVRFPGGSSNTISRHYATGIMTTLTQELASRGYKYFDWNVAVEDAGNCAKKGVSNRQSCVFNYFKKEISPSRANYVLLHDIKSYTAASLEEMIQYALSNGYTFAKITNETPEYHQKLAN